MSSRSRDLPSPASHSQERQKGDGQGGGKEDRGISGKTRTVVKSTIWGCPAQVWKLSQSSLSIWIITRTPGKEKKRLVWGQRRDAEKHEEGGFLEKKAGGVTYEFNTENRGKRQFPEEDRRARGDRSPAAGNLLEPVAKETHSPSRRELHYKPQRIIRSGERNRKKIERSSSEGGGTFLV